MSSTRSNLTPAPGRAGRPEIVALSALWLLALAFGPQLLDAWIAATGISLNEHGHAYLHAHGHPFIDARVAWSIPNAADVLSNLPFLIAGAFGFRAANRCPLPAGTARAVRVFFAGLLATGVASATYHWAPDVRGLMWDRLGMAITFAGALALSAAERYGQRPAQRTLAAMLVVAAFSVAWVSTGGNVLPWAVVQFGGMAFIVRSAFARPVAGAIGIRWDVLIALYVLAKVLEGADTAVFELSGGLVSGHSLKHVVAALAALPVIAALNRRRGAMASVTVVAR